MVASELRASDVSISLNKKNSETLKPEGVCLQLFLTLLKAQVVGHV
jgi:hypothetical protein